MMHSLPLGPSSAQRAALLLLLLASTNGLQICQQADLCISLEHTNVTEAAAANSGAQGKYLLVASSGQRCGTPAHRAGPPVEDSQTVVLVQLDAADADAGGCSLVDILAGATRRAGVILAGDAVPPANLPLKAPGLPPAVLVSLEAGQQVLYLSKIVDSKKPVLIDLYKDPVSQYDLLAEVNRRTHAPIGLPFLTAFLRYMSQLLQTSENNMNLMIARYRRAMSAEWKNRPGKGGARGNTPLLREADLQAMEDFALQTASYFVVLVVAAMLGAAGASLLTATSRSMRAAAVSQLPTVIYRSPDGEDTDDAGSAVTNRGGDVVTLLRGLSSDGGAVLEHMGAVTTSITDNTAADFLSYLSERDPQMFSDVQDVVESTAVVLQRSSPVKKTKSKSTTDRRKSTRTRSQVAAEESTVSSADQNWSFQRLARTVSCLIQEYSRFQRMQGSNKGDTRLPRDNPDEDTPDSHDRYDYSAGRRLRSATERLNEGEQDNAMGHALLGLHSSLMQARDTHFLNSASRQHYSADGDNTPLMVGKGVACPICLASFHDGETLTKLPCDHLFHRKCAGPWLTHTSPYCPVCQHFAIKGK